MTDQEQTPAPPKPPPPHHLYQPADTDVRIVIRFIGNTAEVAEIKFLGGTPGHMMAAAKRLEFYANQAWAIQERQMAQMGIQPAPPGSKVGPGGVLIPKT